MHNAIIYSDFYVADKKKRKDSLKVEICERFVKDLLLLQIFLFLSFFAPRNTPTKSQSEIFPFSIEDLGKSHSFQTFSINLTGRNFSGIVV